MRRGFRRDRLWFYETLMCGKNGRVKAKRRVSWRRSLHRLANKNCWLTTLVGSRVRYKHLVLLIILVACSRKRLKTSGSSSSWLAWKFGWRCCRYHPRSSTTALGIEIESSDVHIWSRTSRRSDLSSSRIWQLWQHNNFLGSTMASSKQTYQNHSDILCHPCIISYYRLSGLPRLLGHLLRKEGREEVDVQIVCKEGERRHHAGHHVPDLVIYLLQIRTYKIIQAIL